MSPLISLKNDTLDGKLSYCNIGVSLGDFIGIGEGEIKVTAYSIDTNESWDVPFKWASRGTMVYELETIETTAATNNLVFAISLIPASKEDVRRIIVNIAISYRYHEGALNWALWKDGSGSLAREKIHWNKDGELTLQDMTIYGMFVAQTPDKVKRLTMGANDKTAYISMLGTEDREYVRIDFDEVDTNLRYDYSGRIKVITKYWQADTIGTAELLGYSLTISNSRGGGGTFTGSSLAMLSNNSRMNIDPMFGISWTNVNGGSAWPTSVTGVGKVYLGNLVGTDIQLIKNFGAIDAEYMTCRIQSMSGRMLMVS